MDRRIDFREAVAAHVGNTADWRRRKAEEYDRDSRNTRSALGLDELAAYVRALPATDARIERLRELSNVPDLYTPGQQAAYEIGRFRFFNPEAQLDPFLTTIVQLAEADAGEQGRFGGRMPPGDDPWD